MKKRVFRLLTIVAALVFSSALSVSALSKEKTQEELLAEYYAALAKMQQQGTAPAQDSQEEQLKQYYAALAKMQGSTATTVPATEPFINNVEYKSGNPDKVTVLQNAYNNLPSNVRSFLNKQTGFVINACSYNDICAARGGDALGYAMGSFQYFNGKTTIKSPVYIGDRETPTQSTNQILYHELGHAVDYYKSTIQNYTLVRTSDTWPGWQEMQNYTSSNTYNPGECFAQAFSFYFIDPQGLQNRAPGAYAYISSIIASLN